MNIKIRLVKFCLSRILKKYADCSILSTNELVTKLSTPWYIFLHVVLTLSATTPAHTAKAISLLIKEERLVQLYDVIALDSAGHKRAIPILFFDPRDIPPILCDAAGHIFSTDDADVGVVFMVTRKHGR